MTPVPSLRGAAAPRAAAALLAAALLAAAPGPAAAQQVPDTTFADTVSVARPAFRDDHPRVLIDEAHHDAYTLETGYGPFAALLRADGYAPEALRGRLTAASLAGARLLVVANALGAADPEAPGAGDAAFDSAECAAAGRWVEQGGALLLAAGRHPCGAALGSLAERFGVSLSDGVVGDTLHYDLAGNPTWVEYTPAQGLAADHPIATGRDGSERVQRVVTFGGASLRGPAGSAALLALGSAAFDVWPPDFSADRATGAAGKAQAVALTVGKGRVVVLGDGAMMTAQRVGPRREPVGIDRADDDDRKFALNVVHWLTGVLP